jgi:hypothetical protein
VVGKEQIIMPPNQQTPQTPGLDQQIVEQQKKELQANYIVAVQNLAVTSLENKKALISSWLSRDKLINDFFTFSLITLGLAATILTAKSSLITSKPIFYVSLTLLTLTVIFSSFARLYLDFKTSAASRQTFDNFNDTISKIDVFRLDPENIENKVKMEESVNHTTTFVPQADWLIKYSQVVIVSVFVVAFLLFILSLVISVNIPK